MDPKQHLRVVLHQVQSMDNLGAVARLMANFEIPQLWLSDPHTQAFEDAGKMAVKAGYILEAMRVVPTLAEALEDVVYVLGTTSRDEVENRPWLTPEAAAEKLQLEAARGPVALVFGGERRGLSDQELALCQDLVVIPTSERQPSMNLAQAAAVMLYLSSRQVSAGPVAPEEPGAQQRVLRVLEEKMRGTLLKSGFLNPQQSELILRELERSLTRGRMTQREAELWVAAFKQLERALTP